MRFKSANFMIYILKQIKKNNNKSLYILITTTISFIFSSYMNNF